MRKLSSKRKIYLDRKSIDVALEIYLNNKRLRKESKRRERKMEPEVAEDRSALLRKIAEGYKGVVKVPSLIRPKIPQNFSLINNPQNTLKSILKLAAIGAKRENHAYLLSDQSEIKNLDLAAIALLDIVLLEMKHEAQSGAAASLEYQGVFPKEIYTARLIRAIGSPSHLDLHELKLSDSEKIPLEIFDKRVRHHKKSESPVLIEPRERIAESFIEYVSRCLVSTKGLEINELGVAHLSTILCEIINNAEEHAGMTDWSLMGYLDVSKDVPVLEVAMINFGKSMAQTFQELDRNGYTWDQIKPYVDTHRGRRFFGKDWAESDLLTVIALQPNISSKNTSKDSTRGAGTTQLLDFFQFVDKFCHGDAGSGQMAILSGSTHIYFDGTHSLARVGDRDVIAFNEANDLALKPDREYVRSLSGMHFPGTIISIKLPLPVGVTTNG